MNTNLKRQIMKNLRKRIDNMNFYLNSKGTTPGGEVTIRGGMDRMSSTNMTHTLDKTRNKRVSDKLRTNVKFP